MKNVMEINGYKAAISFDPDTEMFRGEFLGLNGGADFYASDVEGLRVEGEISLKVYLEMCQEKGIKPEKDYSGKFNLRIDPDLHENIAALATAENKSLNQWIADALDQATER